MGVSKEMWIICSELNDGTYLVFDTQTKRIVRLPSVGLTGHFYGVTIQNGVVVDTPGYAFFPVAPLAGGVRVFTLVGKFLSGNQLGCVHECFLLVSNYGEFLQKTRQDLFTCILNGVVSNVDTSTTHIRLKQGTLPVLTVQTRQRVRPKDTVSMLQTSRTLWGANSPDSPGVGKKFLGQRLSDAAVGMVKYPCGPCNNDNRNEILCYELGKLFGVPVCEAASVVYKGNDSLIISVYQYAIGVDNFRTCMRAFVNKSSCTQEEFRTEFSIDILRNKFGQSAVDAFHQMILFDLIVRQEDRHIRNFAFVNSKFYPLYDNGRCLFWNLPDDSLGWLDGPLTWDNLYRVSVLNEHGYGWSYVDSNLTLDQRRSLIRTGVSYSDIFKVVSARYSSRRARLLSRFIFSMYSVLMGGYALG